MEEIVNILQICIWVVLGILLIAIVISVCKLIRILANIERLIVEDIKPIMSEVKYNLLYLKDMLKNVKAISEEQKGIISWMFSDKLWRSIDAIKGFLRIIEFFKRKLKGRS